MKGLKIHKKGPRPSPPPVILIICKNESTYYQRSVVYRDQDLEDLLYEIRQKARTLDLDLTTAKYEELEDGIYTITGYLSDFSDTSIGGLRSKSEHSVQLHQQGPAPDLPLNEWLY